LVERERTSRETLDQSVRESSGVDPFANCLDVDEGECLELFSRSSFRIHIEMPIGFDAVREELWRL
jgi:hypothetical protein